MNTHRPIKFTISQGGFLRFVATAAVLACALFLAVATPAYAYGPPGQSCAECHGREGSEATTDTVAPTRKGPHGKYGITTRKCAVCHSVHGAPTEYLLLPGTTPKQVCESCHDGTGGTGVYGAIEARGAKVRASHSIETTDTIPDGAPDGSPAQQIFSGPGGTLTCVDCHSPRDSATGEPFFGDRLRAAVASESVSAGSLRSNRLLKKLPGAADGVPVAYYGSEWCASCHQGYHLGGNPDAGRHPVGFATDGIDGEWRFHYDSVRVVSSLESSETTWGPLGSSNRGYVMPRDTDGNRIGPQDGVGPLCQQCHEDAREAGGVIGNSPVLLPGQEFSVSAYGPEEDDSADNPRFQVFPHESNQRYFITDPVPEDDADEGFTDAFCTLRCHAVGY